MVRIGSVGWKVTDIRRAAGFWTAALGYPDNADFVVLADPEGNLSAR